MAKARYRNTGGSIVAGSNPGEEFSFDFSDGDYNEQALIDGGAIERLTEPSKDELLARAQGLGLEVPTGATKAEIQALIDGREK